MCGVVLVAVLLPCFFCGEGRARVENVGSCVAIIETITILLLCFVVFCVYWGFRTTRNAFIRKPGSGAKRAGMRNSARNITRYTSQTQQLTGTRILRSTGSCEAGGGGATHSLGDDGVMPEISWNDAPQEEAGANEAFSRREGGAGRAARPRTAWNSGVMEEDVERNGALAGGRRVDYCLQVICTTVRRRHK